MSLRFIGNHSRIREIIPWLQHVNKVAQFDVDSLAIYLDGMDYSNIHDIRDDFKFPAFFWCVGDSVDRVPSGVLKLMSDSSTQFIIWLSKSLLDSEATHIMWVYAHELRHLMQWRGAIDLNPLQSFLKQRHCIEGFSGKGTQLERPDELDSELFAKATLKTIIGEEALSLYISKCRTSGNGDAYFRRFEELEVYLAEQVKP